MSYIGQFEVDIDKYSLGSTLYGTCNSLRTSAAKVVTMPDFDELIPGVTIYVKFTRAVKGVSNLTLAVGSTPAQNIAGTFTCEAGEIIAFTYEKDNSAPSGTTGYWYAHASSNMAHQTDLSNIQDELDEKVTYKGELNAVPNITTSFNSYKTGDLIIVDTKEYIYKKGTSTSNSYWTELGDESNILTIDPDGGLYKTLDGVGIKTSGIETNMIDNGAVTNDKIENPYVVIAGNEVELGGSITLADLGLSTALHFVGIATNDSLVDESTKDPFSSRNPPDTYNGTAGDVVIDRTGQYEYVWDGTMWERLGGDESYKVVQDPVSDPTTSGSAGAFIDSITQDANGVIHATKKQVSLEMGEKQVYADLTNVSQNVNIYSNANPVGIGIDGVLGIGNGGLGVDANDWASGGILYGKQDGNDRYYTTSTGQAHQILTFGTSAPIWTTEAYLTSASSTDNIDAFTTLELGNDVDKTDNRDAHSEGRLIIYSMGTEAHTIRGMTGIETAPEYVHYLPLSTGYLVQTPTATAIGSSVQSVYVAADGLVTPITYTPNLIYYASAAASYVPSNHYIDTNSVGLGITSWPVDGSNNPITDTLYVDGDTTITGVLQITSNQGISQYSSGALSVVGSATIGGDLVLGGDLALSGDLVVTENTTLTGAVGIGGAPDSSVNDVHILHITGSTLISGASADVAHLDIGTNTSGTEILIFKPEAAGLIGTSTAPWYSANFSEQIQIGDNLARVLMHHSGYIDIVNDNSSILLSTIDNNNAAGVITITATIPQIRLTPIVSSPTTPSTWIIKNNANQFIITDETAEFSGTETGWQLTPHVGIGMAPETVIINNLDPHVLLINGSTQIYNNTTSVAHLDIDTTDSSLKFYPSVSGKGTIGTEAGKWFSLYLSKLLKVSDTSSAILSVTDTTSGQENVTLEMTSTTSSIILKSLNSSLRTWTISTNGGVLDITDSYVERLVSLNGNEWGFRLFSRLYINYSNILSETTTLDLYVNGQSELFGNVGLGAEPLNDARLYVYGNSRIRGHLFPDITDIYNLGIEANADSLRWSNLYLSDSVNIEKNDNGTIRNIEISVIPNNVSTSYISLYSANPAIIFDTPNANVWTIINRTSTNSFEIFSGEIQNGSAQTIIGNNYGFRMNTRLYINEENALTNADTYILYVGGTSYFEDDVTFAPVTAMNSSSPKLLWSGTGDSASIYYCTEDPEEGRLVINTADDANCLIALAKNDVHSIYIDTRDSNSTGPAIYPVVTNSGSLGLTTNRWSAVYIGTADTYGDPYLPVYWNNGVPTSTFGVTQYMPFTFTSGQTTTTLINAAYNQLYGIQTYVLQIVVTSGANFLSDEITWSSGQVNGSTELGYIRLETDVAVTGTVVGYIITARGTELTNYVPPTPPSE